MVGQLAQCEDTNIAGIIPSEYENIKIIEEFNAKDLNGLYLIDFLHDIAPGYQPEMHILESWIKHFKRMKSPFVVVEFDRKNHRAREGSVKHRQIKLFKQLTGNRRATESATGPAVSVRTGKSYKRANPNVENYY